MSQIKGVEPETSMLAAQGAQTLEFLIRFYRLLANHY